MKEIYVNGEFTFIGSVEDCEIIAAEYDENRIKYEIR